MLIGVIWNDKEYEWMDFIQLAADGKAPCSYTTATMIYWWGTRPHAFPSVTALGWCPLQSVLQQKEDYFEHFDSLSVPFRGTLLHKGAEQLIQEIGDENVSSEEKIQETFTITTSKGPRQVKLGGTPDIVEHISDAYVLGDFKSPCNVARIEREKSPPPHYRTQLAAYAAMLRNKKPIASAWIESILPDGIVLFKYNSLPSPTQTINSIKEGLTLLMELYEQLVEEKKDRPDSSLNLPYNSGERRFKCKSYPRQWKSPNYEKVKNFLSTAKLKAKDKSVIEWIEKALLPTLKAKMPSFLPSHDCPFWKTHCEKWAEEYDTLKAEKEGIHKIGG